MANLKDIRSRIASVQSTKQITNAMKMVSAAKLRKAQDAVTRIRPYANKQHEILEHLSASGLDISENPYAEKREPKKVMIVAISSNRGLCGPFNANVSKKVIELLTTVYAEQFQHKHVHILTLGKKGGDILASKGYRTFERADHVYEDLTFGKVSEYANTMMKEFIDGKYDRIDFVYNQFKNAAVQILRHEQFLPIHTSASAGNHKTDYIFEPDVDSIVKQIVPNTLRTMLYKVLIDSFAAEQGARMTAMHKATDNATQMIRELKLTYNKARQAAITTEILEITAGAEALKG